MQKVTSFSMKDCLSLQSLRWKVFNEERGPVERDEEIYVNADK